MFVRLAVIAFTIALSGSAMASVVAPAARPSPDAANPCGQMASVVLPDVHVISAEAIAPAPVWTSSDTADGLGAAQVHTPFCRVEGVIEKEIGFELWLPPPGAWNGRYLGAGNGGDAGFINYLILGRGVSRGFAAASTDTGHKQSDLHWALGHPDRLENYGYRAQHLMAVNAKKLIADYYGRLPDHAYFLGCSGGGAQGMNEVQRYPADYDGVIAGASGTSMVPLSARFLMSALMAASDPAGVLTPEDWRRIAQAAIDLCDAQDGVKDGVIEDPRTCRFDPARTPGLSPEKVRQAKILLGPLVAADGTTLYPGFSPGAPFAAQGRQIGIATRFFGEWLYQNPDWDPRSFDLGRDYAAAEDQIAGLRFTNPDLSSFVRRGGKLITYVGWADPIVPGLSDIDYWENVARYLGPAKTSGFFHLFMVPGMGHCSGGAGATEFGQAFRQDPPVEDAEHDVLTAMVAWVEQGRPPEVIVASHVENGSVTMSRPLCAYPKVARYRGSGDPNDASNFACAAAKKVG